MALRSHTPDLLDEARTVVLAALLDGPPLTLPQFPRGWPVTRPMLTFLVEEMFRAGWLTAVPVGATG